ncbi:hypothetical protein [Hyphomonas atlantica]|uniref:hypothetical protein n=1 Tax=Hyphomonas atlantica TaxID=1280948 RepID=UPI0035184ED9
MIRVFVPQPDNVARLLPERTFSGWARWVLPGSGNAHAELDVPDLEALTEGALFAFLSSGDIGIGPCRLGMRELSAPALHVATAFHAPIEEKAVQPSSFDTCLEVLGRDEGAKADFVRALLRSVELAAQDFDQLLASHCILLTRGDDLRSGILFALAKRLGKPAFVVDRSVFGTGVHFELRYSPLGGDSYIDRLYQARHRLTPVGKQMSEPPFAPIFHISEADIAGVAARSVTACPLGRVKQALDRVMSVRDDAIRLRLDFGASAESQRRLARTIACLREGTGDRLVIEQRKEHPSGKKIVTKHTDAGGIVTVSSWRSVGIALVARQQTRSLFSGPWDFLGHAASVGQDLSGLAGASFSLDRADRREIRARLKWVEQSCFGGPKGAGARRLRDRIERAVTARDFSSII